MQKYVEFGNFMNEFIVGKYEAYFNGFVLLCICVAGVLVGMQTYEEYESNATLEVIDNFILVSGGGGGAAQLKRVLGGDAGHA